MNLQLVPARPTDMGFPDHLADWRSGQAEVINEGIVNDRRVFSPCAGTGFGKTLFYVSQALLEGGRTFIVVQNKGLQDQIIKEYACMGMVDIRGKSNYPCPSGVDWTCKDGYASGCTLKGTSACKHTQAYNLARYKPLVVTNYKCWISTHRYGLGFGHIDRVVFDEAQSCPDELADSLQIILSHNEMEMLKSDFPPIKQRDSADAWKKWATAMRVVAQDAYKDQMHKVRSSRDPKKSWIMDLHHYKNLIQKFAMVGLMRPGDWVWEESQTGYQFDPIKYGKYAESRMLQRIKKVTMTSATFRPKTAWMMNIKNDDMTFLDIPSPFPAWRSPLYHVPTMKVDKKATDYFMLVHRIDQIVGPRLLRGRNGIIHVSSFPYRDQITRQSGYKQRMTSHWDGNPSSSAVLVFKRMGGVLVSPSVGAGYDFPGDQCRFQILTKIPWQPTNSKIIQMREEVDPGLAAYHAMQRIVQQAGRGCRSEDDWCENFILDDHFEAWFLRMNRHFAPQWFLDRYQQLYSVPRMMEVAA